MSETYLQTFVEYLKSRTDAPAQFHLHAGLCTLALALGNRVWCDGYARDIYPNLHSVILAPSGMGKALVLDTPIPTPDGWTDMGRLKPGDMVLAGDGTPTRVLRKSPVWMDRDVYRVTSKTGDTIVADAEHLWQAVIDNGTGWRLYTTADMARPRNHRAHLPVAFPLQLPEQDLPIRPYTLGAWLGDGSSWHGEIHGKGEDLTHVRRRVEAEGYVTSNRARHLSFGVAGLRHELAKNHLLRNKHIPPRYLRASVVQRLALLHGLIDTDGHVQPFGAIEFCTTNATLAENVRELVCTLGAKVSVTTDRAMLKGMDCGPRFRVRFFLSGAASMDRKQERCIDGVRTPHHYVDVAAAGHSSTACITVEHPSGMFLAGRSMIPTHNSVPLDMAGQIVRKAGLGDRILPGSFSREAIMEHLATTPVGVFILQEFAAFMALLSRDYNHGAVEDLTDMYDGSDIVRKLTNKTIHVQRPAVTLLGASSPEWFAQAFSGRNLRGGYLARFLFCPSSDAGDPIGDPGPRDEGIEATLALHLHDAAEMDGRMDFRACKDRFDRFATEARLRARESDADIAGMRSRAPLMARKVAMLFHVSRDLSMRVTDRDMERAITFVTKTQDQAERYLLEEVPRDAKDANRMRILEIVRARGGVCTWSTALKNSHMDARDFKSAIQTLMESGQVEDGKDGRARVLTMSNVRPLHQNGHVAVGANAWAG